MSVLNYSANGTTLVYSGNEFTVVHVYSYLWILLFFWVISSSNFFASCLKEPFPPALTVGNKRSVPQLVSGWIKISYLHFLSAGPAAEKTYYIRTEDQQINEIHPFSPSQLSLSLSLFLFPRSSPSLFPQRLLRVFLLDILYATRHAERIIKKEACVNIIRAFWIVTDI